MKNKDTNFIIEIINTDLKHKTFKQKVQTRFPPEPNGYLHIGHAKSISINFGIARKYKGQCNLRFDDTNPLKENLEYVESIINDVKWLGYNFKKPLFASDYFDQMYNYALKLIDMGKAYVDDQSFKEIHESRGTLKTAGVNSPYRKRSVDENIHLFNQMKEGIYKDGEKVLRAKIDMSSPNINMRDPILYRILHTKHHRTKNNWCIYPMYDWAHGLEDSIENITHSICTLEFEDHRPLYDWFLNQLNIHHPKQIEFARLNLNYTIMSKRMLKIMVENKIVNGWDDPRMPTLSGLRKRGYTPEAINNFIDSTGIVKRNSTSDIAALEHFLREDLNLKAKRAMVVFNPLKIVITNYPKEKIEIIEAINNPEDIHCGKRKIPFGRELYIEQSDFMEYPKKKFFRLSQGSEVRLMHAYYIICEKIIKNKDGDVIELHCKYDPKSKGGWTDDGRKVKGTLHWVSIKHAISTKINLYDRLFNSDNPMGAKNIKELLKIVNPNSLSIVKDAKAEPSLQDATLKQRYQFIRKGYFILDANSKTNNLHFNQSVALKDSWIKKNVS